MTSDFPRLLLLHANPLNSRTSNMMTLTSLLMGWPRERIVNVYVPFAAPMEPDTTVCSRFYAVTPRGLLRAEPVDAPAASATPSRARALLARIPFRDALRPLANPVREWYYSRPARLRGAAATELAEFRPQVILSGLGLVSICRMAQSLAAETGAPIVPFITDDWFTSEYAGSPFGARLRRELQELGREIVDKAPVRFVISSAMAAEYERRFGGSFLPFTRGVPQHAFDSAPRKPDGTVRLSYSGNLALDRADILLAIADAVQHQPGIVFEIRASEDHWHQYGGRLRTHPAVSVKPFVSPSELPRVLAEADILVHVEAFGEPYRTYTRFSFSTKLSEYLMAGRPICFVGPAECGSAQGIRDSGAGLVVGDPAPDHIAGALSRLLADPTHRAQLGECGRRYAERHFDEVPQRERFQGALVDSVTRWHAERAGLDYVA